MRTEQKHITQRRWEGEFFTPLPFAQKALAYIEKTVGKQWWRSGEYRLWDMAAGTGNLEYHLPSQALPYCYLSTLYHNDTIQCQTLFKTATCFTYDYLNDDVEHLWNKSTHKLAAQKLPEKLQADLQNPNIKWIVLINPPFATSQTAGATSHSKQGVSDTKVRKIMHQHNLGEVSRELFSQFIFRIRKEFEGKTAYLGLFSKIKYLNAANDDKLRQQVFQFMFERGFIFSSANFSGTSASSRFPVGFLVWKLFEQKPLEQQNIKVDVLDNNVVKTGSKTIEIEDKSKFLNTWIQRPAATIKYPPVGSAINLKTDNKDKRDRVAKDFVASFMCAGNNIQCQNQTALFSMPSASAGAFSVTPDNFEKAMVVHAVRRIPKATWINDRDQFMQPTGKLSKEFITDCAIWSLFSNSNQTAAMRNVTYEGEVYQIHNHLFPFALAEVQTWQCSDNEVLASTANDHDRFACRWLHNRALSAESAALLNLGKQIYRLYFEHLHQLNTAKFRIETWDAGWWQVRNVLADAKTATDLLEELKILHNKLRDKLLPQIEAYKFIS